MLTFLEDEIAIKARLTRTISAVPRPDVVSVTHFEMTLSGCGDEVLDESRQLNTLLRESLESHQE